MRFSAISTRLTALICAVLLPVFSYAYDPDSHSSDSSDARHAEGSATEHVEGAKPFNPGEMIVEHISDAHEWHLWGHTHMPLPVILKTDKGWEFFSSGKFRQGEHHELGVYQGTHYAYKLDDHGKIVAWDDLADKPVQTASILDLSITKNVVTLFVVVGLMMFVFFSIASAYKKKPGQAPKGMQSFFEPLIVFVRDDIAKASIGPKYERYMPYLLTVFFFIWISNMLGLIPIFPGGANFTGNIAITMTLAVITFVITTFSGNAHYWRHIFAMPGVPIPILIILTPIEILGMFLKPLVLMIRLFANITAGHIIALSFYSLIFIFGKGGEEFGTGIGVSIGSVAFTVFMMVLELLVAFLQAYVFTLLSAIYFGSAVEDHHHPNEDFDGLPNAQHAH